MNHVPTQETKNQCPRTDNLFLTSFLFWIGGWCEVSTGTLWTSTVRSHCQIEITTDAKNIVARRDIQMMSPMLICSVDGEMYSATNSFPDPRNPDDVIIGIGLVFRYVGTGTMTSTFMKELKVYLALKSCVS